MSFIQRFGGSLNLNPHFHSLSLDGTYDFSGGSQFVKVDPPSKKEIEIFLERFVKRVISYLTRKNLIEESEIEPDSFSNLQGASILYKQAFGKYRGQPILTLGEVSTKTKENKKSDNPYLAKFSGFTLHAGVRCSPNDKTKLENLCRYISRPSLSEDRLKLNEQGNVVYRLKTPYETGQTHLILTPVEFLGRLAALIPKPRHHLVRYYGVFAPNFNKREEVVNSKPNQGCEDETSQKSHKPKMSWSKRLKRVFKINHEVWARCGGKLRIVSSIEDPAVIKTILVHLGLPATPPTALSPRAPP